MSCRNRLQREIILNQFFQMNPVCCLLDLVPPTSLPPKTTLFKDGPISKSTMITNFWTNWVVNHKVSNLSHGSSWSEPRGGVTHVHDAHYFLITCASPLHIHSMLSWVWIKSQRCIFQTFWKPDWCANLFFFWVRDFKFWLLAYFFILLNCAKFQQDWTTLILDIL